MVKEIAIFKTDTEDINVEVIFEDETVWLTQEQMAQMFEKAKSTINEHIKHIFEEGELDKSEVVRNFRITTKHGAIEGKTQTHEVQYFNFLWWNLKKATLEYRKYQQKTLSDVEKAFLDSIKEINGIQKDKK